MAEVGGELAELVEVAEVVDLVELAEGSATSTSSRVFLVKRPNTVLHFSPFLSTHFSRV